MKPTPLHLLLCATTVICTAALGARATPAIAPDAIVAADGTGQFTTIQAAVAAIPPDNRERRVIFIKNGIYHEKLRVDPRYVTLEGESRSGTRIEFAQGANEFHAKSDALGIAVLNINGDDCIVENLTIENTQGVIGVHAFAVYGRGDRTVIQDCDMLSQGNDTLSLWRTSDRQFDARGAGAEHGAVNGRYYHARLKVRGSVDFICPRGWCYMKDSDIYEVNPRAEAAIWHDGSRDPRMKFVLQGCRFDGVEGWQLARHHHDAQIYLLDCTFSSRMRDVAPHRVVYPLGGKPATDADRKRNAALDATNRWGERFYFWNCHRDGGDYAWLRDNLSSADGSPKPADISAAWTFDGTWNPESTVGPGIDRVTPTANGFTVTYGEPVTVKGKPHLTVHGTRAVYASGSGTRTLTFTFGQTVVPAEPGQAADGVVIASEASAAPRFANLTLP